MFWTVERTMILTSSSTPKGPIIMGPIHCTDTVTTDDKSSRHSSYCVPNYLTKSSQVLFLLEVQNYVVLMEGYGMVISYEPIAIHLWEVGLGNV